MTNDDKFRDEKLPCDINREAGKISELSSGKIDIYMNILQVKNITSQSKENVFTYSTLYKAFKNQIKTIEDQLEKQIKALEEHGKQLIKSSGEKESLTLLKQK